MFLSPLGPRINVAGGEGTVTSVALTAPSIFSVSGSPVVGAGTLDFQLVSQTQNKVLASPSGIAGIPSFRALVAGDLPSINFTNLADVPASYTGQGGKVVAVNVAENALEFIAGGGGGGSSTFIGLTDVPAAFTGASLKSVRVNAGETALEFFTPSAGGSGDVVGPASSTNDHIAVYSGTTGKIIKDSHLLGIDVAGSGTDIFTRSGARVLQLAFGDAAGYFQLQGSGAGPIFGVAGSTSNLPIVYNAKGTGTHNFFTSGGTTEQARITHTASAVNRLELTGGTAANPVKISAAGADTNISINLVTKGTGQLLVNGSPLSASGDVTGPASAVDNALAVYNGTTGKIIKNQATAITADSNGILGINNISKALRLVNNGSTNVNNFGMVGSAAGNPLEMSAEGTDSNIHMYITTKGTGGIAIRDGAAATPALMFGVDTNTGIFRAAADQLGISTGGTERAKFTTNLDLTCGQIKFPSTQNPSVDANTLDDYEEGTWTPVLTFATPGDLAVTYAAQAGSYVKIGNSITINAIIITSSFTHTTAANEMRITGKPFASSGNNTSTLDMQGITKAGGYTNFAIKTGGTDLECYASGSGVARSPVVAADMPTGGTVAIIFGLTYFS